MKRPTETSGDWEEYAKWLEEVLALYKLLLDACRLGSARMADKAIKELEKLGAV